MRTLKHLLLLALLPLTIGCTTKNFLKPNYTKIQVEINNNGTIKYQETIKLPKELTISGEWGGMQICHQNKCQAIIYQGEKFYFRENGTNHQCGTKLQQCIDSIKPQRYPNPSPN